MTDRTISLFAAIAAALVGTVASAHVSISSGPAFSNNSSQEVTFGVGHGCTGADTFALRIEIPAGVTSVRPMASDFGPLTVETDGASNVTAVVWQRPEASLLASDVAFYKFTLRLKPPNQPFTQLYFLTHQTCKVPGGATSTAEWTALPGAAGEPAPELTVLPPRKSGWNKYTVPHALTDLSVFFSDAQIVWRGSSAYSSNAETTAQIAGTAEVAPLTALAAGDEIWVKY